MTLSCETFGVGTSGEVSRGARSDAKLQSSHQAKSCLKNSKSKSIKRSVHFSADLDEELGQLESIAAKYTTAPKPETSDSHIVQMFENILENLGLVDTYELDNESADEQSLDSASSSVNSEATEQSQESWASPRSNEQKTSDVPLDPSLPQSKKQDDQRSFDSFSIQKSSTPEDLNEEPSTPEEPSEEFSSPKELIPESQPKIESEPQSIADHEQPFVSFASFASTFASKVSVSTSNSAQEIADPDTAEKSCYGTNFEILGLAPGATRAAPETSSDMDLNEILVGKLQSELDAIKEVNLTSKEINAEKKEENKAPQDVGTGNNEGKSEEKRTTFRSKIKRLRSMRKRREVNSSRSLDESLDHESCVPLFSTGEIGDNTSMEKPKNVCTTHRTITTQTNQNTKNRSFLARLSSIRQNRKKSHSKVSHKKSVCSTKAKANIMPIISESERPPNSDDEFVPLLSDLESFYEDLVSFTTVASNDVSKSSSVSKIAAMFMSGGSSLADDDVSILSVIEAIDEANQRSAEGDDSGDMGHEGNDKGDESNFDDDGTLASKQSQRSILTIEHGIEYCLEQSLEDERRMRLLRERSQEEDERCDHNAAIVELERNQQDLARTARILSVMQAWKEKQDQGSVTRATMISEGYGENVRGVEASTDLDGSSPVSMFFVADNPEESRDDHTAETETTASGTDSDSGTDAHDTFIISSDAAIEASLDAEANPESLSDDEFRAIIDASSDAAIKISLELESALPRSSEVSADVMENAINEEIIAADDENEASYQIMCVVNEDLTSNRFRSQCGSSPMEPAEELSADSFAPQISFVGGEPSITIFPVDFENVDFEDFVDENNVDDAGDVFEPFRITVITDDNRTHASSIEDNMDDQAREFFSEKYPNMKYSEPVPSEPCCRRPVADTRAPSITAIASENALTTTRTAIAESTSSVVEQSNISIEKTGSILWEGAQTVLLLADQFEDAIAAIVLPLGEREELKRQHLFEKLRRLHDNGHDGFKFDDNERWDELKEEKSIRKEPRSFPPIENFSPFSQSSDQPDYERQGSVRMHERATYYVRNPKNRRTDPRAAQRIKPTSRNVPLEPPGSSWCSVDSRPNNTPLDPPAL